MTNYTPSCVHISAAEGQPSTFWVSKSGKYYRTKSEAIADTGIACNPAAYEKKTSFLVKYRYYMLAGVVALALLALTIFILTKKGIIKDWLN